MTQTLKLDDALYNAGLLGFITVLRQLNPDFITPTGTELTVDLSIFENGNFTKAYLRTLLLKYKSQTKYQTLMDEIRPYITGELSVSDVKDENYKKLIKSVKSKLDSASYKAAYEIIENNTDEHFDFVTLIKEWKSAKELDLQIVKLKELYSAFKKYGDTFALKDIIYNFIQPYWSGVSFLHKAKNKTPFEQTFEEDFIYPILKYKPKKGKKIYHCLQCDAVLSNAPTSTSMAWINDIGVDIKRKTNGFWNFNVDLAPCPLCNLIYACIPLGFHSMSYEGIFVNCNSSFSQLERMNNLSFIDNTQTSFAVIINQFLSDANQTEAEHLLQNIQVIRRYKNEKGNWEYRVNIFSAYLLNNLTKCKKNLEFLAKYSPQLHRMVINDILDGKNLYPLLYKEYRKNLKGKYPLSIYFNVLQINITMFGKENCYMDKAALEKSIYWAREEGRKLQADIASRVNDKNNITLSYGLLNALQTGNSNQFLQIIMRRYLSLGKQIPDVFIQAINDDDSFQAIGNAFLIGLSQSGTQDKKEKDR